MACIQSFRRIGRAGQSRIQLRTNREALAKLLRLLSLSCLWCSVCCGLCCACLASAARFLSKCHFSPNRLVLSWCCHWPAISMRTATSGCDTPANGSGRAVSLVQEKLKENEAEFRRMFQAGGGRGRIQDTLHGADVRYGINHGRGNHVVPPSRTAPVALRSDGGCLTEAGDDCERLRGGAPALAALGIASGAASSLELCGGLVRSAGDCVQPNAGRR